jgi:hypothetical protein
MAVVYDTTYLSGPNAYRLNFIVSGDPTGAININTFLGADDPNPLPVVELSSNLYLNRTNITSITANNVTTVGASVFQGCTGMTSASLTSLASITTNSVFQGCTSLTTPTLTALTAISGNSTFSGCTSLASFNMSNVSTLTGTGTFKNCSNLTSITSLNAVVTSIPQETFYNTNFSTFSNSNILTIGESAFQSSTSLTTITFINATTVNTSAFQDCTSLLWDNINLGKITQIPSLCFSGCQTLGPSINFENISTNPITSIGSQAFQGCGTLTSVIATDVNDIDIGAFLGCGSLSSVQFGALTELKNEVFSITGFTSINLANISTAPIITIADQAFAQCTSLVSAILPDVTTMGAQNFQGCIALVGFSAPSLTTMSTENFKDCTNLNAVYIGTPTNFNPNSNNFTNCTALSKICYNSAYSWVGPTFGGISIAPYTTITIPPPIIQFTSSGITVNTSPIIGGATPIGILSLNTIYRWYKDGIAVSPPSILYTPLTIDPGQTDGVYTLLITNYFEEVLSDNSTIENMLIGNRVKSIIQIITA